MEIYEIGSIYLRSDIPLPPSIKPFRIGQMPPQKEKESLCLTFHPGRPSFQCSRKIAEHELMNVWMSFAKDGSLAGWLFEDIQGRGVMEVSSDYRSACFYGETFEETGNSALRLLLQALLECRLIYSGVQVVHAACVETDAGAIIFSAPSGTGKSTRAKQFVDHLGASWISGDRPALDVLRKQVYGVPWDGKEQIFVKKTVPVRAIVEVRRSHHVMLKPLTRSQTFTFLAHQLLIPMWDIQLASKALHGLEEIAQNLPVLRLYSDCTPESARETDAALRDLMLRQSCIPIQTNQETINYSYIERIKEMKLKDGFEVTMLDNDYMLIPTGDAIATFGGSVVLNEVSAFLLNHMKAPITRDELLNLLLAEYEVEEKRAAQDLDNILETFRKLEIIE